jgi:3-oxoacyl-[acyl-carrier protein] reductase
MMSKRYGRVINVASVSGIRGNKGQTNYSASKGGVIAFTRSVAMEFAGRKVTVNAVAPGFIDTEMTQSLGEEVRNALLGQIPLGRLGSVEDVAHAVRFLASDQAAYVTGQVIHVNGGLY